MEEQIYLWKTFVERELSYGIGAYGKDFIYNMIAAFLMIFILMLLVYR